MGIKSHGSKLNWKTHVHPMDFACSCFCIETVQLLNARFWLDATFTGLFAYLSCRAGTSTAFSIRKFNTTLNSCENGNRFKDALHDNRGNKLDKQGLPTSCQWWFSNFASARKSTQRAIALGWTWTVDNVGKNALESSENFDHPSFCYMWCDYWTTSELDNDWNSSDHGCKCS